MCSHVHQTRTGNSERRSREPGRQNSVKTFICGCTPESKLTHDQRIEHSAPEVLGASLVPNIPWVYDPRIQTTGDLVGAREMAFASGPCGLDFDHHTELYRRLSWSAISQPAETLPWSTILAPAEPNQ